MTFQDIIRTRLSAGSSFFRMCAVLVVLLGATAASAQTKSVQLFVKEKELGPGIAKEDEIEIREPSGATFSLTSIKDSSVCIGVLVDSSNSSKYTAKILKEEVLAQIATLFQTRLQRGRDAGFVMSFDSTVTLLQDLSDNPDLLVAALTRLQRSGATSLHDALISAAKKLDRAECVRRVIILISDGDDNQSAATREEAIQAIQEARCAILALGLEVDWGRGTLALKNIAQESGGALLEAYSPKAVSKAFATVNALLDSAYTVQVSLPAGLNSDRRGISLKLKLMQGKKSLLFPSKLR